MQLRKAEVLELDLTADELVAALLALAPERRACLLDSCGARGDDARFLIAGFDPVEMVEAYGEELHVRARGEASPRGESGSVLSLLDARLKKYRVARAAPSDLPARGACVAAFAYDLAHQFERLSSRTRAQVAAPDAVLYFFDTLVVHDYARGETRLIGVGDSSGRLPEVAATLRRATDAKPRERGRNDEFEGGERHSVPALVDSGDSLFSVAAVSNFTREEYTAAVERIREHIYAGDIYQANLTQQLSCAPSPLAPPARVFERLRRAHPASFAAFLRLGEGALVSASPERFLRVQFEAEAQGARRVVEAWPIKGTRRRGRDAAEDALLRAELLSSAKDRAENVMIVDLLRNDLGRVCRYGTVAVAELCALQEHPTLFHLVSKVRGILRDDVTAGELMRAAFPCGSITGAPKIRAMRIIDEIETARRGFSMGAVGYFSFDGALDLNVAIRTITFAPDGAARFNVGGGIVAESDPDAEYEESLLKARALLRALRVEL